MHIFILPIKHLQSFQMTGSKGWKNSAGQGTHSIYNIHAEMTKFTKWKKFTQILKKKK